MKKIFFMFIVASATIFAIDCTKIDFLAYQKYIVNNMNISLDRNNSLRIQQRKDAIALQKCIYFNNIKGEEAYSLKRIKALKKLSKIALLKNERVVYKDAISKNIAFYRGYTKELKKLSININGKLIFLAFDKTPHGDIFIQINFLKNKKIIQRVKIIKLDKFKKIICSLDSIFKLNIEIFLNQKFECVDLWNVEVDKGENYPKDIITGTYILNKIQNFIYVNRHHFPREKMYKNTVVDIMSINFNNIEFENRNNDGKLYYLNIDKFKNLFTKIKE